MRRTVIFLTIFMFVFMNIQAKDIVDMDFSNQLQIEGQRFATEKGLPDPDNAVVHKGVPVGGTEYFWAMKPATKEFYQVEAVLRKVTRHSYIYVQKGQDVSDQTVENFAHEFDNIIYPSNHKYFGSEWKPGIDHDERITMLFLDIEDGYDPQTSPGFVAGYFFPMNEYSKRVFEYSNEREMLYIDTYPADPASEMTYSVIAHEFQHMQHWNEDAQEEIWLNEACSQLSMRLAGYDHPNQILAYMRNPELSLTAWASDVMLENYGAVYLFNYYLASKFADGQYEDFTLALVRNQKKGIESVRDTLADLHAPGFDSVFDKWLITNLINTEGTDYYYDETIGGYHVHPSQVYSGPTQDWVSEKVLSWGSEYVQFSYNTPCLPVFPTFIDKIQLRGEKPGTVIWGVNGWKKPLSEYIPDGSNEESDGIYTPLKRDDSCYSAAVGAFRNLSSQTVNEVNFRFVYEDGTESPEYNVPVMDYSYRSTSLKIEFDGASGSWWSPFGEEAEYRVYVVCYDSMNVRDSLDIRTMKLDSDNDGELVVEGYGTLFDTVVLMPVNPTKNSSLAYKYKAGPVQSARDVNGVKSQAEYLKRQAVESMTEGREEDYLKYLDRMENLGNTLSDDEMDNILGARDDDSDTSHTNIGYLLSKNREATEAL
ncbi:MAG: hypothetical protein ACOCWO_01245, partial [Candidatus Muiribacteriaceae bacterium]